MGRRGPENWATGEVKDWCRGKRRFPSKGKAEMALRTTTRNGVKGARPVAFYGPCPSCQGWHLTSQPR